MPDNKLEIKYIPLGGGIHLNYGDERSPLGTLLSKIVDDQDHTAVNNLFDYIMKGTSGATNPTKQDLEMNLSTLSNEESWVFGDDFDAQGIPFKYAECNIGDITHSIVTYDTLPEKFKDKMPADTVSTAYSRVYTFNDNLKFAHSYGYLHYTPEATGVLFSTVVLPALWAGVKAGAAWVKNALVNGANPEMGAAAAGDIGAAGEAAAAQAARMEGANITVDEDLLLEAAGEDLVAEGVFDIALGPIGLLLLVGTIIIIAVIAFFLWVWSFVDKAFVMRVLVFNATKTALIVNPRYLDNVNTDKKYLPSLMDYNTASNTRILQGVYHRVPPIPPGNSVLLPSEGRSKYHNGLEDSFNQACIDYALYSIVNNHQFLDGVGTLISLDPQTDPGKSPIYKDFTNAFYQYTIRSTRDNVVGIATNDDRADYESLYNSLGTETHLIKQDLGTDLEVVVATDALGGNKDNLYSVVKVLRDKGIAF